MTETQLNDMSVDELLELCADSPDPLVRALAERLSELNEREVQDEFDD